MSQAALLTIKAEKGPEVRRAADNDREEDR